MPKHGSFCWAEIATKDPESCKAFYNKIFGWEFKKVDSASTEMVYEAFNLPGEYGQGAIYKMSEEQFWRKQRRRRIL